jgi:hypothetical protein
LQKKKAQQEAEAQQVRELFLSLLFLCVRTVFLNFFYVKAREAEAMRKEQERLLQEQLAQQVKTQSLSFHSLFLSLSHFSFPLRSVIESALRRSGGNVRLCWHSSWKRNSERRRPRKKVREREDLEDFF